MALRRVVAAIDVVINGQRMVDRLAQSYATVDKAVQTTTRSFRTYNSTIISAIRISDAFAKALNLTAQQQVRVATGVVQTARRVASFTEVVRGASSGFMGFVNAIDRGRERLNNQGKATRGLTDNIVSLTRSMLLFSVMLPLVQLPQRAVESMGEFVKVGGQWQDQLRVTNTLLNLGEKELAAYSDQVQQMSITYGLVTEDVRALMTTAASSVSAIKDNAEQVELMGQAAYNAHTALQLATGSARLAYSTGTQATEATTTLIQVMATYGLEIEHLATVSDSLFAITDVGTIRFGELEHVLPRVTAAMGPLIQQYDKAEDKINVMNESFAAFAAMTQVMSPEQAATSYANVFKDIGQMTGQQRQLVTAWERQRKAQGLGEEQSLVPEALLSKGPIGALVQLRRVFDLRGEMMNAYVANQRRLGNTADEDAIRMAGQSQLMQSYFDDMRAVRGFQLTSAEQLESVQQKYEASREGAVGRGVSQMDLSFVQRQKQFQQSWTAVQTKMFQSIEQPLIGALNPITEMFTNLVANADFNSAPFLSKLRILGSTMMTSFANYFRSGGRGQIQTVGREIGTFVGESLTSFFRGGKDNVLVEAGLAFSEAFVEGIAQTLPALLSSMLQSTITRGVAEAMAIRYMTKGRMPNTVSYAASTAIPFGLESANESDNPLFNLLGGAAGTLLVGGAAFAGGRRLLRTKMPVSTFGQRTIGGMAGAARNAIMNRAANPAYNRSSFPTGRGWPGFGSIARSGAGTVGGGLLGAALSLPAILEAENDRERWSSIGSMVGMIGGGALGGLAGGGIGSALLGIAGGLAGQQAGGWAGGGLYDLFHPGTGKGGVAEADAPERMALAETFAVGVDASQATMLLTQIRDILIRNSGGTLAGRPVGGGAPGGGGTPGGGTTGTGMGLQAAFVDQINNNRELTSAQAQAACGPAAAAFFARAYGRNPTLKEAYALVSRIQGGAPDAPGVGGTRGVATLGTALNQMGVASEVYQGSNIDWGRLAENAKQGIPGIVNIGPNPATGFPGHFFQIGGYNPETGQFNVGPSGGVLNAGGNKTNMTAEEMMALGPKQGAIYGLGKTGAAGNGNVTEADIAAIPTTAGTGTGPGGMGGAVTVNIQNMMNVEHMDGSTDIRALMGQMADILRQLSTGGSVVGQTGAVAP